jgi:hypothetical protein
MRSQGDDIVGIELAPLLMAPSVVACPVTTMKSPASGKRSLVFCAYTPMGTTSDDVERPASSVTVASSIPSTVGSFMANRRSYSSSPSSAYVLSAWPVTAARDAAE